MANFITYFLFAVFLISSCSEREGSENSKTINPKDYKEPLIEANKKLVKSEDEMIDDYIARYKWKMTTTESGLRYLIYKRGGGAKAKNGVIARINYSVGLLNGELCYSSD